MNINCRNTIVEVDIFRLVDRIARFSLAYLVSNINGCLIGQTMVGNSHSRFRFENAFCDFTLTFVSKLKFSKTDEKSADFYRIYFDDSKSKTVNNRPFSSILSIDITFVGIRETSCFR